MKLYLLIFSLFASTYNSLGQGVDVLPRGTEAIYKAKFNVMGTSMNGFLAVRHKRNHVLHVSFTSPMGNNLLEMRWKNGRWKKIYAIDKLGKRQTFKMMAEDILLLFAHYQFDDRFEDFGNEWKWNKKTLHPVWKEEKVVSVKVITRRHHPSKMVNYAFGNDGIERMNIEHQGFPFSIELQPIKKK